MKYRICRSRKVYPKKEGWLVDLSPPYESSPYYHYFFVSKKGAKEFVRLIIKGKMSPHEAAFIASCKEVEGE